MATFSRILVPTDFSALSVHAAGFARSLAQTHGAELRIIHVSAPPPTADAVAPGPGVLPVFQPPMAEVLDGVRVSLAEFVRAHFEGLTTTSNVLVGVAHREICQYARDHSCDLIVIGSHARGIVHRIFLGSVSKSILEHSPCPLLMVPLKSVETTDEAIV